MGSLISSFAGTADSIKDNLFLYIILGIIALVIISVLLDGIKRFIRGLDIAALGALFIWLGFEADKIAIASSVSDLLYLVGGTLAVTGVLVFIIIKLIRGKRKARRNRAMQQAAEKEQRELEEKRAREKAKETEE